MYPWPGASPGTVIRKFFFGYEEIDYPVGDTETISHYFANGQRIATRSSVTGLVYIHSDHLGSATRQTDENGTVLWDVFYDPYGELVYFSSNSDVGYGFTGQELDQTSWHYYGSRYYSPEIGRFLQPDPMFDGPNRYMYCAGNPVRYVDPSGMAAQKKGTKGKTGKTVSGPAETDDPPDWIDIPPEEEHRQRRSGDDYKGVYEHYQSAMDAIDEARWNVAYLEREIKRLRQMLLGQLLTGSAYELQMELNEIVRYYELGIDNTTRAMKWVVSGGPFNPQATGETAYRVEANSVEIVQILGSIVSESDLRRQTEDMIDLCEDQIRGQQALIDLYATSAVGYAYMLNTTFYFQNGERMYVTVP